MFVLVFFFFKQKTAYEMRISDWSSDVCSSDLDITTCAFDLGNGFKATPTLDPEGEPKIVWLIVPVEGSMLKEFFAVTMVVQNLAPAGFGFVAGSATLDLPSGLALPAQNGSAQPAEKPVEDIDRQSTRLHSSH